MKIEELFDNVKQRATGIATSSENLEKNCVFVCIKGVSADGHDFAEKALRLGASFIVCEKDLGLPNQIVVDNTREAYATLCAKWFDCPAQKMKMIAVTGTNGKTTTTTIIKRVLNQLTGKPIGLIGTIQSEIGEIAFPAKYTTPEPFELNTLLARIRRVNCDYVVMEASSHALEQQRLFGLNFEVSAFTNLTHDHLDYHGDMENYFRSKSRLFEFSKRAVINVDDAHGLSLFKSLSKEKKCCSVGINSDADIIARNIEYFANKVEFDVEADGSVAHCVFKMPGKFSVENALVVIGVVLSLGFNLNEIVEAIGNCGGVSGRSEVIYCDESVTIIRDYAHGPDGLLNILQTIRPFVQGRLVLLFGCAGKRDRTKRKEMGEIASQYSDFVVISSDNPRDEDEMQIINDAKEGIKEVPCEVFANRLEATKFVLKNRKPKDLILLAGKGHEDYQVLADCTVYFDEKRIVEEFLGRKDI
ncbi:MAG: UDP-N-acetylmuramoyl-L-alanyl-D-glutamate--2,6-diaminopimelate ligase [Oscillospiraceae bacterium]|nr:UDP-N-acetylmuramoyl-L-alanyl-D-glutamate--2,6-diaminopimelate ligase [Oscillospiraceae bacterium]